MKCGPSLNKSPMNGNRPPRESIEHASVTPLSARMAAFERSPASDSTQPSSGGPAMDDKPEGSLVYSGWLLRCNTFLDLKRWCVLYSDPMMLLYEDETMQRLKSSFRFTPGVTGVACSADLISLTNLPRIRPRDPPTLKLKGGTNDHARSWALKLHETIGAVAESAPLSPLPTSADPVGAELPSRVNHSARISEAIVPARTAPVACNTSGTPPPPAPLSSRSRCDSQKILETTVGTNWGVVGKPGTGGAGGGASSPHGELLGASPSAAGVATPIAYSCDDLGATPASSSSASATPSTPVAANGGRRRQQSDLSYLEQHTSACVPGERSTPTSCGSSVGGLTAARRMSSLGGINEGVPGHRDGVNDDELDDSSAAEEIDAESTDDSDEGSGEEGRDSVGAMPESRLGMGSSDASPSGINSEVRTVLRSGRSRCGSTLADRLRSKLGGAPSAGDAASAVSAASLPPPSAANSVVPPTDVSYAPSMADERPRTSSSEGGVVNRSRGISTIGPSLGPVRKRPSLMKQFGFLLGLGTDASEAAPSAEWDAEEEEERRRSLAAEAIFNASASGEAAAANALASGNVDAAVDAAFDTIAYTSIAFAVATEAHRKAWLTDAPPSARPALIPAAALPTPPMPPAAATVDTPKPPMASKSPAALAPAPAGLQSPVAADVNHRSFKPAAALPTPPMPPAVAAVDAPKPPMASKSPAVLAPAPAGVQSSVAADAKRLAVATQVAGRLVDGVMAESLLLAATNAPEIPNRQRVQEAVVSRPPPETTTLDSRLLSEVPPSSDGHQTLISEMQPRSGRSPSRVAPQLKGVRVSIELAPTHGHVHSDTPHSTDALPHLLFAYTFQGSDGADHEQTSRKPLNVKGSPLLINSSAACNGAAVANTRRSNHATTPASGSRGGDDTHALAVSCKDVDRGSSRPAATTSPHSERPALPFKVAVKLRLQEETNSEVAKLRMNPFCSDWASMSPGHTASL